VLIFSRLLFFCSWHTHQRYFFLHLQAHIVIIVTWNLPETQLQGNSILWNITENWEIKKIGKNEHPCVHQPFCLHLSLPCTLPRFWWSILCSYEINFLSFLTLLFLTHHGNGGQSLKLEVFIWIRLYPKLLFHSTIKWPWV
jgi:hypothetical protein